jgi:hypothetical protein
MAGRPYIRPGHWIDVGSVACVVSTVREPGHASGDCEVVFNALKPTSHDVEWDGDDWRFVTRGNSGGPADRYPRLAPYVAQLKAGRP